MLDSRYWIESADWVLLFESGLSVGCWDIESVSRCTGYMRDTKGYSVKKSAYAFVPVSEGNVLAPVWLQPDPTDRKKERSIAMKNNDAGDWDQTPS